MKPYCHHLGLALSLSLSLYSNSCIASNTAKQIVDQNIAQVSESLRQDIKTSQQALAASEQRIAKASAELYRKLHKKQVSVTKLREQAVLAKRKIDEQTLGLQTLQSRLKKWQDQQQYQRYLLIDFAEKVSASDQQKNAINKNISAGLALIKQTIDTKKQQLQPTWQQHKIVLPEGAIEPAEIITIGPVSWFWQHEQQRGGLVNRDSNSTTGTPLYTVTQLFKANSLNALAELYSTQQGSIVFDPTIDRAQKIADQQETIFQHIQKGGLWVAPILLFALVALIIATGKALQLWRLPKLQTLLIERIQSITKGENPTTELQQLQKKLQGSEAELLAIALDTSVSQQRDERLFACLLESRHRLEKLLGAIAVTAAVSPLLGLLGTVSGMIETFKMMTIFGTGDPSTVSGGISEALITTEMGLVVAIPALLLHALLSRHIRNYNSQLETTAIKLGPLQLPEK